MKLNIKDTFTANLKADPIVENYRRQVRDAFYSFVTPKKTAKPQLLHVSNSMLENIGISKEQATSQEFLNVFTGNSSLPNTKPFAMCYGGHQFGNWAGQLGDGRAINIAEITHNNQHWALQLKGAGPTPYSRGADGLAVLRSSIREYLCSEAMYYLGVPTTRALSLSLTGDQVKRDILYNGNSAYEKGAVVCRVAPSFLRFGNFEIFAAHGDSENLKNLVDFTVKNHFPELGEPSVKTYLAFFESVVEKTLAMIIDWQRVGFVHGVMNTDNMSILGLTIDYGPYGWLEGYQKDWTPNTTDRENRRYRYGQQLAIGLWNLYKLANALFPLINDAKALEAILEKYNLNADTAYLEMMKKKLGLQTVQNNDQELIDLLEILLEKEETDMTLFFRRLSLFNKDTPESGHSILKKALYNPLSTNLKEDWQHWFIAYANRLKLETITTDQRTVNMNSVNPKYVLRNYMAQMAIDEADKGNYQLIDELFILLQKPYDEQPDQEKWFVKRPDWARNKVGCSMLSCSS